MPFIIGLFAFTLIPIIASFALSFTNYDILSTPKFAGLDNYIRMFTQDPTFWKSFGVTFFYAVVSVPLKLIMALMVAMFFQRTSRATSVYRHFIPSL